MSSYRFACTIKHETESAILVYEPETQEEIWFPLSQINAIRSKDKEGNCELEVTEWIAKKKGLL